MRVLHYINQFFGQLGGEDSAYSPLEVRESTVGPGNILKDMLSDSDIVVTAICGDNYFNENESEVLDKINNILDKYKIDVVIAGPAFNAGRYGMACGSVCKAAFKKDILTVSGMYNENPGFELYGKFAYIFPTDKQARGMKEALEKISTFVNKVAKGGEIGLPDEEGYYKRGIRRPTWREKSGAERAVDMVIAKSLGREFTTEVEMMFFDRIIPSKPVLDLSKAKVAIVTSAGMVPIGNPDRIEAAAATKWEEYTIEDYGGSGENFKGEVAHGGYTPVFGNEWGCRILPYDAFKELESRGVIGEFYEKMFVTVGNAMDVTQATKFGKEMAAKLIEDEVDAVLLTST